MDDDTVRLEMATVFYISSYLPILREYNACIGGRIRLGTIAEETLELSLANALQYEHKVKFTVPSFRLNPLTGVQVIALQVAVLWVLCGEDEALARELFDAWPIREAVLLAGGK